MTSFQYQIQINTECSVCQKQAEPYTYPVSAGLTPPVPALPPGWRVLDGLPICSDHSIQVDEGRRLYKLMIYFAVATLYFYRDSIVEDSNPMTTHGLWASANEKVLKQVQAEALRYFDYELSHEQIGKAVAAYRCASPKLTKAL